MQRFLQTLATVAIIAVIVLIAVAIWQPNVPGRWCANGTQWRVCYREWLIPISGLAAAIAAAVLILFERERAKQAERRLRRAARMRVCSELASLSQAYIDVMDDIKWLLKSDGNAGNLWDELPLPSFAGKARDLEDMPEVEDVLKFAEGVARTNREIPQRMEVFDPEEVYTWVRQRAAEAALEAIELHDRLAAAISARVQWNPLAISEVRKTELRDIAS